MSKGYFVEARWDAEAGVFISKSNIPGLVVEAATVEEFMEIVRDLAPDLLTANLNDRPQSSPRQIPVRYTLSGELQVACA